MATVLYLIRHGETEPGFPGRYIGSTDPGLSEKGRESCRHLAGLACDALRSSPLKRALETARLIPAPLSVDPRLREIDFGAWEKLTFGEIAAQASPAHLELWTKEPDKMYFPGGERVADFYARVDEVFAEIAALPQETVAVVTHGGVLMRIMAGIRGKVQYVSPVARGGMLRLERIGGKWHEK